MINNLVDGLCVFDFTIVHFKIANCSLWIRLINSNTVKSLPSSISWYLLGEKGEQIHANTCKYCKCTCMCMIRTMQRENNNNHNIDKSIANTCTQMQIPKYFFAPRGCLFVNDYSLPTTWNGRWLLYVPSFMTYIWNSEFK